MQKEHQQQKKARLQELMEDLIGMKEDGDRDSLDHDSNTDIQEEDDKQHQEDIDSGEKKISFPQ